MQQNRFLTNSFCHGDSGFQLEVRAELFLLIDIVKNIRSDRNQLHYHVRNIMTDDELLFKVDRRIAMAYHTVKCQ